MCRMLGYLGPPITLQWLLIDPPHSLHEQAWAPHQQIAGVLNADGFGVGWYDLDRRPEPARYRSTKPMWADHSFISMAGVVTATAVLAAVRSATPPSLNEESSTAPFVSERWLFAHNGKVEGFRDGVSSRLRRSLSERRDAGIFGTADSEVLFALALDRLDAGMAPADALVDVVKTVDEQDGGTLTMLLTDGESLAATAVGNSMSVLAGEHFVVLASEPFDDDQSWAPVPNRSVLTAVPGDVQCEAL
jgi:glutamine amidotransferase